MPKNFEDTATVADLKEVCLGADSDFLVEQIESGATIGEGMQAWMAKQQLAVEKSKAEAAVVKPPEKKVVGVDPGAVKETERDDQEADGDFDAMVRAEMKLSGCGRMAAIIRVAKRHPDEHKAFLLAQKGNKRTAIQRKIGDRFEYATELRAR